MKQNKFTLEAKPNKVFSQNQNKNYWNNLSENEMGNIPLENMAIDAALHQLANDTSWSKKLYSRWKQKKTVWFIILLSKDETKN